MNVHDVVFGSSDEQSPWRQQPAADFSLPDTQGNMHRLKDYRGNWLLLVFHRHLA